MRRHPVRGVQDILFVPLRVVLAGRPLINDRTTDLGFIGVVDQTNGDIRKTREWGQDLFPLGRFPAVVGQDLLNQVFRNPEWAVIR